MVDISQLSMLLLDVLLADVSPYDINITQNMSPVNIFDSEFTNYSYI